MCDAPSPGNIYESSSFVISYKQMQSPTLYTTCSKKKNIKKAINQLPGKLPSSLYTAFISSKEGRKGWQGGREAGFVQSFKSPSPNHTAFRRTPISFECNKSVCFYWHWKNCYKQKSLAFFSGFFFFSG